MARKELKIKVVPYEHIDAYEGFIDPLKMFSSSELVDILPQVAHAFTNAGWEGDGEINLIWLPPFLFKDADTIGEYIWHVKQSNNGTSFLGFTGMAYNFEIGQGGLTQ